MIVSIRRLTIEDLPELVSKANHPLVGAMLRNRFPYPYTESAGKEYLTFCMNCEPTQSLPYAILVDKQFVGCIGVDVESDVYACNGELGYWLGHEYWGKGIASKAVSFMIKEAFEKLPITRLHAEVFEPNKASQAVLKKNGFVKEAHFHHNILKHGEVMDSIVYAIYKKTL